LYYVESQKLANITIYGEFLEKYPPEYEVRITTILMEAVCMA